MALMSRKSSQIMDEVESVRYVAVESRGNPDNMGTTVTRGSVDGRDSWSRVIIYM